MYGGKFAFQNQLGQLLVGKKFTVFALFYFVFEGKFQVQAPRGGLHSEEQFNGGFFGLPFWGAYMWRGLYMEGLIVGILLYSFNFQRFVSKHSISIYMYTCANRKRFQLGNNMSMMKKILLTKLRLQYRLHQGLSNSWFQNSF